MRANKSIAAIGTFALSFALVFSSILEAQASVLAQTQGPSLRDLSFTLQTPEEITDYLWRHFTFESDQRLFGVEEYWQTPEEFMAIGKGDCEDFARFAYELLRLNGIPAYMLNVYGDGSAHTVTVYRDGENYNIIDLTNIREAKTKDIKRVAAEVNPFWESGAFVRPSKETKKARVLKQFERRMAASRRLATSA